jgi:hypothetical protein
MFSISLEAENAEDPQARGHRKEERAKIRARRKIDHFKDLAADVVPDEFPEGHTTENGEFFKIKLTYEPRSKTAGDFRNVHHQVMCRTTRGDAKPTAKSFGFFIDLEKHTDSQFQVLVRNKFDEAVAYAWGVLTSL